MLKDWPKDWKWVALDDLGALRVRGPDAVRFLQGQLSNDIARLTGQRSILAGFHNPQGRTIALLRLVQLEAGATAGAAPDDLLAILPRELAATVATRLSKYVLRSKVKITDESASWPVAGLIASEVGSPSTVPPAWTAVDQIDQSARWGNWIVVRVSDNPARWLVIPATQESSSIPEAAFPADPDLWRRLDVAAGLPQVYAATSEEFVAQMLNLDVLNAIAFDKGCYTGQEVIARAHYRGRVKRRLQRFIVSKRAKLERGTSGQLADGRAFKVVEAVQLEDGRCEFLAVAPLTAADGETDHSGGVTSAGTSPSTDTFDAQSLPLSYALPD